MNTPKGSNKLELPKTYLDRVAYGMTIILGGRVYKKAGEQLVGGDCVIEGNETTSLIELEEIARLENKYRIDNNDEIKKIQTSLLDMSKSVTDVDIKSVENKVSILAYVVGEVFPYFGVGSKSVAKNAENLVKFGTNQINSDDEGPTKTGKKEIKIDFASNSKKISRTFELLNQKKEQIKSTIKKKPSMKDDPDALAALEISRSPDARSVLTTKVLDNQDIMIYYDILYTLGNKPHFRKYEIQIGDRTLYPHPGVMLSNKKEIFNLIELKQAYNQELLGLFRQEAINNHPYKQKLAYMKSKLESIIEEPATKAAGLTIEWTSDNSFYLCKRIEEFVLKELHSDVYHWFASTRVGVGVTVHPGGRVSHTEVVVMDEYDPFPFLNPANSGSKKPICTGTGQELYKPGPGMTDANIIANKLTIGGEQTLYRGYHGNDFTPYKHLDSRSFSGNNRTHRIVSLSEIKKNNWEITNVVGGGRK